MRKFLYFISMFLGIVLTSCYNKDIEEINNRLDSIENSQIATIESQIMSINSTLSKLEKTDADLKDYILSLQKAASKLSDDIEATNNRITDLKTSFEDDIDSEIAGVIALLEAAKSDIESELSAINALITNLENKDTELEDKIKDLNDYVDNGLTDAQDWAMVTFATLDQYNELAEVVATVGIDTQAVTDLLTELEERIDENLIEAIEGIGEDIADAISSITDEYTEAISTAKEDITDAYNEAIKTAVEDLEASMELWVNTQLAGYYTIAEADAQLEALKIALESKITASENSLKDYISELEIEINNKIDENSKLIASLENDLSSLAQDAAENANSIIENATAIEANAEKIRSNAQAILDNDADIEANAELIAENKSLISENNTLIQKNQSAIALLQNQVSANEQAIVANATTISKNAADISANAAQIANNAAAIADNLAAITTNAADIAALQEDLVETAKTITQAYKNAIENAITTLNGELRDHIASEIATVNATIDALTERVTALEKEVKNIKVAIYNIQNDITVLQEQVAAILARIQSISYVPKYADGNATMYYTNSGGVITAGTATLDFELQPASTATELLTVWESALSAKAVYTLTRAAGDFVNLPIQSVTAKDGILTVVLSGSALDEAFFRSEISANVRLQVSDGNNQRASEYVNMVPWTMDNIYIPDANFKAALLATHDTNSDGEISPTEAEAVTAMDISGSAPQITSLEGIEYFTNLVSLDCSYNKITSLNLVSNTKLTTVLATTNQLQSVALPSSVTTLDLSNNKLSTVDVSKMKGLTTLNVANNKLGSLNVSQNTQLTELLCLSNNLASLDVTKLLALKELNCSKNQIESLNLANNTALTSLNVSKNALKALDVTKCTELEEFACNDNQLTKLYIVGLSKLPSLDCSNNALTELNLPGCTNLATLDCSENALTTLNILPAQQLKTLDCSSNNLSMLDVSNNSALTTLDCSNNPNLTKVWFKDNSQLGTVSTTKDNTANIYYNNGGLTIPDAALKAYLVNNYDDNGDGEISILESDNITMVNCSGKGVADLTGLEACTNLVTLNCANNNITTISLPNLKQLKTVTCNDNPIEKLNFDNCTSLQYLNLQGITTNAISGTAISINNYAQATTFDISVKGTQFVSFSFTNDTDLTSIIFDGEFTEVNLSGNSLLEGVDVSALQNLEILDIQKCNLQSLDVTKNLALTSLICSYNELTTLDVSKNTSLAKFYCNNNQLPRINVITNTALEEFDISHNLLSVLNVSSNIALTHLNVSNNVALSMVDVKANSALKTLYCNDLAIGELNIVNNTALTKLECHSNDNLTTLTCNNSFDFTNTHISVNKGLSIINESSSALTPSIGDLITVNLSTGVVFEASNGSFKIVSIEETNTYSWYSANSWCSNYGADWYLPSLGELTTIFSENSTLNRVLSTELKSNKYSRYWSSKEWSSDKAYYYNPYANNSNGYTNKDANRDVDWKYYVRAVLTF